MGRFVNKTTGVVVTVDDSKDDRFAGGDWDKQAAPSKSQNKK